ncbi:SWIRM-domain-containing protein [Xylona heveae TC161]|uniref:SWIRM-domain-containing protein n=1 Tax=Xylona heveae (strain CBS 132557 / TC161) TaxID=1328760 RepID=A0A165HGW6_XYLHT|nr:SWIRM-domain-containing protein [Xylona heveae TC161]KZF23496.1 SWIRM-domain-containing protein [Xylona heveae TC161]
MTGTGDEAKKDAAATPQKPAEGADEATINGQPAAQRLNSEASARTHLVAQTHAIILPSYSTWFDMHKIHTLEKKALPEFFNNRNRSKTPAVYKDYRDFMINTYRLNPSEYLTVTACRRNLAGDVCAIMRVHAFLEQWGLINYQIDPDTRPSAIAPPFTGHFRITADTPRGLQSFQPGPNPTVVPGKPFAGTERAATSTPASKADLNLEIRRNIYDQHGKDLSTPEAKDTQANGEAATNGTASGEGASKSLEELAKEPKRQFNCSSCGVDCTRVRYHSAKSTQPPAGAAPGAAATPKAKYDLCPNCYLEGRFPSSSNAIDFVKLEDTSYSTIPDRDSPWTDAELLLLLEGLELFDDNWNSIADHVGTRTREECVLKFLQLEIEDKYLETESTSNAAGMSALLGGGRAPFSQGDNPVMSVVAFLAGLSPPSVSAAAAGKSIGELRDGLRAQVGKSKDEKSAADGEAPAPASTQEKPSTPAAGSTEKGPGQEKEHVKDEDSMDVDTSREPTAPAAASTSAAQSTEPTTSSTPAPTTAEKPGASSSSPQPVAAPASSSSAPLNPLATTALAASAARAAALASHEEREMTRLVSAAVNATLSKFELKLQQFNEMEAILQAERRELERGRQQLFLDRLSFKKRVREVQETLRAASLSGGEEGSRMAQEALGGFTQSEKLGFRSDNAPNGEEIKPLSADGQGKTFEL